MDRHELIERLMATFFEELEEKARIFDKELLALERDPKGAGAENAVRELFRAAHSLKGAASAVDADKLAGACHRMEELLAAVRDGARAMSPELIARLFAAADLVIGYGEELRNRPQHALGHTREDPARHQLGTPSAQRAPDAVTVGDPSKPASRTAVREPPHAQMQESSTGELSLASAALRATKPSPASNESAALRATEPSPAPDESAIWRATKPSPPAEDDEADVPDEADGTRATSSAPGTARSSGDAPGSERSAAESVAQADVRSQPRAGLAGGGEGTQAVVRIPARRLDTLLAQSGELLVARRRFDTRPGELAAVLELVSRLRAQLRKHDRARRQGSRRRGQAAQPPTSPLADTAGNRDALELSTRMFASAVEQLTRIERELERCVVGLREDGRLLARAATPLEDQIHQARLLPFGEACEGLLRGVRDLGLQQHKNVDLVLEGGEVELDRSIVDGLRDPLVHLCRNAVDHGVETPDERRAAGKPTRARIVVAAAVRAEWVEVTVSDDGRGVDFAAVRRRALQRGLRVDDDEHELCRLLFQPGFSTAATVTQISGRGVGLDVVKSRVEAMRGHIELSAEPGRGARFTLALPLTLTTARVLLVRAGGEVLALPCAQVVRLMRVGPDELRVVEGRPVVLCDGPPAPIVGLAEALGLPAPPEGLAFGKLCVVLIRLDGGMFALRVDELIAQQEVVLKPLGKRLQHMRYVSAATLLPSGRIAFLLKPVELLRAVAPRVRAPSLASLMPAGAATRARKRLLLVDDSVTTRTLEKSILETAGHEVMTASDGAVALQLLEEHGADLVLSDVEMPNMDGIALAKAIRASKRFRNLPIVLLTALEKESDRMRGLEAGADAYLVKRAFDQKSLLETIRQLL